jgi:dCMP deaminase
MTLRHTINTEPFNRIDRLMERRRQIKWNRRFMEMAKLAGTWSKDPSTGTGCVLVRPDRSVSSIGYNGFPRGVEDREDRLNERPTKLAFTVHAELNAILAAGEVLEGYTCYVHPFPPCANCAAAIVQAGISRVVAPQPTAAQLERWGDSFRHMEEMFGEAGVVLETWTEEI